MTSLLQNEQDQAVDVINTPVAVDMPIISEVTEVPTIVEPAPLHNSSHDEVPNSTLTEISVEVPASEMHSEISAVSHEKKSGLPQLDDSSYSSQLFWLAICFVTLYVLISKIILPRIHEVLEKRRHRIEHDLDQADEMSSKADKAKSDYEALHASAIAKTSQQTSDALDNAKKRHDLENAKLDAILADKLTEAGIRIAASRDEMIDKLKPVASDLSAEIVEKLIGTKADSKKLETILSGIKW